MSPSVRSAQSFAIVVPSRSTYGTVACVKRTDGDVVASDSHARNVPGYPRELARFWQRLSAPATPFRFAPEFSSERNTRRAAAHAPAMHA